MAERERARRAAGMQEAERQRRAELVLDLLVNEGPKTASELSTAIGCTYNQARGAVFLLGRAWSCRWRQGGHHVWEYYLVEDFFDPPTPADLHNRQLGAALIRAARGSEGPE